MQEDLLPPPDPLVSPHAQKKTDPTQDTTHRAPLPPYTAKGYLKKHIPKNPELKGAKASKKLGQLYGRSSPKKRTKLGKLSTVSSSVVLCNEVFLSALSTKILFLSGSVVSHKPPNKKI